MQKTIIYLALASICVSLSAVGQVLGDGRTIDDSARARAQAAVAATVPAGMRIGTPSLTLLEWHGDTLVADLTENYGDVPFTSASIEALKGQIATAVGSSNAAVALSIAGNDIEQYFTRFDNAYRRKHPPFVEELDPSRHYTRGLDGNIIAVWPSHGWYFEPKLNRWEWQRARMFQTVEDMYTHSYMIPFIMPMLENAGAYVWDARERDTHSVGAVVDADGGQAQAGYSERNGKKKWTAGEGTGFAYARTAYRDFENPFEEGTYRQVEAVTDKKHASVATWDATLPQAGDYAVYVSYKSLPKSVHDAVYTVTSQQGSRRFRVDQRMAGGVWVYLGTFPLSAGENKAVVTLSNVSTDKGGVVTADAVRIGGGLGNIERRVAPRTDDNLALVSKHELKESCLQNPEISGYDYIGSGAHPWFHLGSRYYLQWAGFPKEVYSTTEGIDDYIDDYRSRGLWVNHLAGGSDVLPGRPGLNVPVDVSFCLHTDAGTTLNDDIIGTLLIYCTQSQGKRFGRYANGTPREISRRFADIVSGEVVADIRAKWEPRWTRRGMWDKPYYEARVPEVPALLMELLSHQNFADMKYGLDPEFRFDVSRAIYKGILKFIAQRDHRDYTVQPLPVQSFAITPVSAGNYLLTWEPTADALAPDANAKHYIVCERVEPDGGFREVATVSNPEYMVRVNDHKVHSYRIIALNDGGRSFPSETLSVGEADNSKGTVMVVNAFTRVSGPDWFESGEVAGFYDAKDHGVPYMEQINYLGSQHEFRRRLPWRDDDAPGFGACRSNHETQNVGGNSFDYPAVHGAAILAAGYSFVSSSLRAVEQTPSMLTAYPVVDLVLGNQKQTPTGCDTTRMRFPTFSPALRAALTAYTERGGNVLATGAYVGSDIWNKPLPDNEQKRFAREVLGFEWVDGQATLTGRAYTVATNATAFAPATTFSFNTQLQPGLYAVESPDALRASDSRGATFLRYSENNIPAGVLSRRAGYNTVVVGFPFETMTDPAERNAFMTATLQFLTNK